MTRSFVVLSLLTAAVLLGANPCTAQSYTLTDLGPYTAKAINNNGQIVGAALPANAAAGSGLSDPYLFSNGTMTDLGNFGTASSVGQAYAINSAGQVVGLTGTSGGSYGPFLFSNGALSELTPSNANPLGINAAGTIVGYLETLTSGGEGSDAFVIQNGVLTDLGAGVANGINASGQIVGDSSGQAAVFQPGGTITLLGFLPGGVNLSYGLAINDAGQVAGSSYTTVPQYALHAFLYSNGTMTDIDTMDNEVSWAFAINNNGVVVGQIRPAYHAFVYMGGSMMDLNTLIPAGSGLTLYQANGINDSGQIVGTAQSDSDGSNHGFLLTPVAPEIASISPAQGTAGTVVTISGKHFTTKPKACTVTFNGKVAKSTKWGNTQIQVEVPTGATTGKVVVTAFFQKSNSKTFTVTK